MKFLPSSSCCHHIVRIRVSSFCKILMKEDNLRLTIRVIIEEQVTKTLQLFEHLKTYQVVSFLFYFIL